MMPTPGPIVVTRSFAESLPPVWFDALLAASDGGGVLEIPDELVVHDD
jgi:hypothetical protein